MYELGFFDDFVFSQRDIARNGVAPNELTPRRISLGSLVRRRHGKNSENSCV